MAATMKENSSTIRFMAKVKFVLMTGIYVWCKNRKYDGEW